MIGSLVIRIDANIDKVGPHSLKKAHREPLIPPCFPFLSPLNPEALKPVNIQNSLRIDQKASRLHSAHTSSC